MRLFPSDTLRSFVRQVCRPRNDSPPLPLGEGWGKGLAPLDKGVSEGRGDYLPNRRAMMVIISPKNT